MNIKPKQPTTLRGAVRQGVLRSLSLFLPGAAIFAVAAMQPIPMDFVAPEQGAAAAAEVNKDDAKAGRLILKNDCDLPAGVIPGHAVVKIDGRVFLAPSDAGFAIWLGPDNKAGTGDEAPGTIYDFCR